MSENTLPEPSQEEPPVITLPQAELAALLDKCDRAEALATQYRDELQTILNCLSKLLPLASGGPKALLSLATNPGRFGDIRQTIQRDLAPILQRYSTENEAAQDGK